MKSNCDYVICPECGSVNAAMWNPKGCGEYDVTCTVCGHEYEHGRYRSHLALSHQEIEQFFHGEGWARHREEDYDD